MKKMCVVFVILQCGAGPSVRSFIDQIFEEPTKIMIVGADCSPATEPIAELAPFWNLVQVWVFSSHSCADSHSDSKLEQI